MRIRYMLLALALAAAMPVIGAHAAISAGQSLSYSQPLSKKAIRSVQQRLHEIGLYEGHVDGNWGPDSAAALQQFQQSRALQVTGNLNEATVKTLGVSRAKLLDIKQPSATAASKENQNAKTAESAKKTNDNHGMNISPDAIKAVQKRLRQLNFKVGRVDGIWGAQTQKALKNFQQGRGLQPTGQINPATLDALDLDADRLLFNNEKKQE